MRRIKADEISQIVSELCIEANTVLCKDVLDSLKTALKQERNKRARWILDVIVQNAFLAREQKMAICQDTGMVVVFIELGRDVTLDGDLDRAVNRGVKKGYQKGYFRKSIIPNPLSRKGPAGFIPAVIHIKITAGKDFKISLMPKGFGSENVSSLVMLNPTDDTGRIREVVSQAVREKGLNACPPLILGIGIGGTADQALILSKQALLLPVNHTNRKSELAELERNILKDINCLGIGPMGLGGKTTALGVNILTRPTHIAGMPLAINMSCHALRRAVRTI
ncbi:MAG: fumarate hydratase [Candidatus Omnitrophota bacterium]|nr:fumarate hydratase [Candidatus Omnitrophota bacterium]